MIRNVNKSVLLSKLTQHNLTSVNILNKRNYYKHTTKEVGPGVYKKTTTIIDHDNRDYSKSNVINSNSNKLEVKSPNTEVYFSLIKIIVKEWQENEELRTWTRSLFSEAKKWVITNIKSISTSIKPIQIGEKNFVILELTESLKESDEEKIRKALNLPISGYVNDFEIFGLKPDYTSQDLSKQYREKIHLWHPDHHPNKEDQELAHLVFKYINESYNRIKHYKRR